MRLSSSALLTPLRPTVAVSRSSNDSLGVRLDDPGHSLELSNIATSTLSIRNAMYLALRTCVPLCLCAYVQSDLRCLRRTAPRA